jgi:hypothetical protein
MNTEASARNGRRTGARRVSLTARVYQVTTAITNCRLALVALLLASPLAAQDTLRVTARVGTGPVTGQVTGGIDGKAIPFALLSLDRPRLDFFGTELGRFTLPALSRGEHRLLVRQLGYSPLLVLLVVSEGAGSAVDLVLEPKALVLPTLVASACAAVGDLDAEVRAVLNAAAENARRLDLVQREYPYAGRYVQVREVYGRDGALISRTPSRLELQFWEKSSYKPGGAIVRGRGSAVDVAYFSATALLAENFRKTHCFRFGGVDSSVPGRPALTLEFEPLASLKGPDWEGKLTLDDRGVLQSSEARLVARNPKDNWPVAAICQVTYEAVGGALPIESLLVCRVRMGEPYVSEAVEEWRLECQRFTKKVPGVESGLLPDSTGAWRGRMCSTVRVR